MKFSTLLVLFFCLILGQLKAQNQTDSLYKLLPETEGKARVDVLNALSWELRNTDLEKAVEIGSESVKLAEKLNYYSGLGDALSFTGVSYRAQNENSKALELFFRALKLSETHKLPRIRAYSFVNIGDVLRWQKNYEESKTYLLRALSQFEEIDEQAGRAYVYIRLGEVYSEMQELDSALAAFQNCLAIRQTIADSAGIETALSRIGQTYRDKENYPEALNYLEQSLELLKSQDNPRRLSAALVDIAEVYLRQSRYDRASLFADSSLKLAESLNIKDIVAQAAAALSEIGQKTGDFRAAFKYQRIYYDIRSDMAGRESRKTILRLQKNYEDNKKQAEIDLLNKDKKIKEWMLGAGLIALLAVAVLVFFFYTANRQNRNKNRNLQLQSKEIAAQNTELLRAYGNITAAVLYARRIQTAMLPAREQIRKALPASFVLFRPRDIVSGDFYWFADTNDFVNYEGERRIIISAVDCTGHGVPGAFMSLIGNDLLNDIITVRHTFSPELVLEALHSGVKKALRQEDGENRDGMDLALCVLNPVRETVEFAGAMNPLVYISENKITTLRGDRMPIGGEFQGRKLRKYTKHTISLEQPSRFYLFSDGYQDQFGGPENKKFMSKQLKQFLLKIHAESPERQVELLNSRLEEWMQESLEKQIDDILFVSFAWPLV